MEGCCRKRGCASLQQLCQIEVIKILHSKAAAMEAEYIDQWSSRQLTMASQVNPSSYLAHLIVLLGVCGSTCDSFCHATLG